MKTIKTILLSLLTACLLMSAAFADVAPLPNDTETVGASILPIVIIIIVLVVLVRKKKQVKTQAKTDVREPDSDACMDPNADNERAKKTDWDHLDPWDLDRK